MIDISSRILIIEDNKAELDYASSVISTEGFQDFIAVTNLCAGLRYLPSCDAVLSDLFFPAGKESTEEFAKRFIREYEKYRAGRFKKIEDNPVLRAVQQVAEVFGVTPEKYVSEIMPRLNSNPGLIKAARDSLVGIEDSERYEKFLKIEEGVRNGTRLPLGIIAAERARELEKPVVIVTSTYHHDDAFEAVRDLVKVPYCDRLVQGRKDWKGGIELLLK